ncbi:MAG TPA: hypothetical protein VIO12_08570 [Thermoanaerobaculia bacterium]|jgi:hypothetical protein
MRALFAIGIVLLVIGMASLVVPIPHRERHGISAGGVSLGVETTTNEKVNPAISAVLIAGGVALMIVGRPRRRA